MSSTKGTIEWRREGEEEETTGGGNLRDATAGVEGTGGGNLEDSYLRRELLVLRVSGEGKIGGDALPDDHKNNTNIFTSLIHKGITVFSKCRFSAVLFVLAQQAS